MAKNQPGVCEQLIGKDATYNNVTNIDAVSGAIKAINAIKEGLGEAFEQEKDYNKAYVGPTSGFDTIQETYAATEKMSQVEQMIFRATTYIGGEGQTTGFTIPATVKSISSGKYSSSGSTLKNVDIITSHGSGENTCITFLVGIDRCYRLVPLRRQVPALGLHGGRTPLQLRPPFRHAGVEIILPADHAFLVAEDLLCGQPLVPGQRDKAKVHVRCLFIHVYHGRNNIVLAYTLF